MLLGNYSVLAKCPGRALGGVGHSGLGSNSFRARREAELFSSDRFGDLASDPNGYGMAAWTSPQRAGSMACGGGEGGTSSASADIQGGYPLSGLAAGESSIADAALGLVVSAVAEVLCAASASADITGIITGSGTAQGGSTTISAVLAALAEMAAQAVGTGSGSGNLIGPALVSATVLPYDALSPQGLAAAVWNSLAANFNQTGSMGERMNAGASGGGPSAESIAAAVWALANGIESGITPQEAIRAILAKEVGATSSLAGPGPITFNSPTGTPRVVLNITDNRGNRADPDLNLS